MKVISEVKLTKEQIANYVEKGYEVYYGYENPYIKQGESVGFILDTMYKSTIDTIISLLYRKHKSKITILYEGKTYTLSTPYDWQHSYKENNKWYKIQHPILQIYLSKRNEYFEKLDLETAKNKTEIILEYFEHKVPDDLEQFVKAFAPLYEIDVDYQSLDDKLKAYASIQYYLENDIPYSKEVKGIDDSEEAMFETISFGDLTYLEDMIYKEGVVNV